jgi:hypothetical protein
MKRTQPAGCFLLNCYPGILEYVLKLYIYCRLTACFLPDKIVEGTLSKISSQRYVKGQRLKVKVKVALRGFSIPRPLGSVVFLPQQVPAFISRGAMHHTDARDLYQ